MDALRGGRQMDSLQNATFSFVAPVICFLGRWRSRKTAPVDDSSSRKREQNNNNNNNSNNNNQCQSRKPVDYDTAASWQKSFEQLMNHPEGRWHLTEFLKGEFSDENILFWQACEELKRESNQEKIEEKARIIYEDFVSILSPKEVSLDSKVREGVNMHMSAPTAHVFDEAQFQIYTLMQRDSYPRYLNSHQYRHFLDSLSPS